MQFLFTKLQIKPKNCFIFISICFCLFVLLCSALYPFSSDEIRFSILAQENLFQAIKSEMFVEAPRFLHLFLLVGLYWGIKYKIFFCIVNPLVQLCLVYGLFYLVKGRKLNINEKADILPFLLICLACLFMVVSPSTTLFCIAGASNYSWTFLLCLLLLCLYRFVYRGNTFKNTWYVYLIYLLLGFAAGMSNENTGPMMFGISSCFLLFCKYKKIKIPGYIYISFLGIILGIAAMFGSGGSALRLKAALFSSWVNSGFINKLFFSLAHFDDFLEALYYMPAALFLGLLITAYDLKRQVLQEKFILSVFFLFCGLTTAFVLFAAPMVPLRAYYSAGMFCLISFFFFLEFFYDVYRIYILKYFTLLFLIFCLFITPFVFLPYVSLYKNFQVREAQILSAKTQGKTAVITDAIFIPSAPTQNLTIEYLDIVKHGFAKRWYGLQIIVPHNTL